MRYCEACKREVGVKLTYGQVTIMATLYCCGIIPGIIYSFLHTKKCPICGAPTTNKIIHKIKDRR